MSAASEPHQESDGPWDLLLRRVRIASMNADGSVGEGPYGAVAGAGVDRLGAVGVRDGRIVYVGLDDALPAGASAREEWNGDGAWVTPGLVDCHTHLVHGGQRSEEFERRLTGVSYEQIAREGGGIRSTVRATREATVDDLVRQSLVRLDAMLAEGLTTVEVKSGYGLDLDTELAMLRAARRLERHRAVSIVATFLGAHALPEEFADRPDDYIDFVIRDVLPVVAAEGLADAVDAFCETIGFDVAQCQRLFASAKSMGLPVKLHAEQLSNQGGAAMLAGMGGQSADHLEWLDGHGVACMQAAGTVAVLLPGAFYFLRETRVPPVDALRAAGVPIALATDCNPGSSPLVSPLLTMNMASVLFGMTPAEALAGMTREGARALGLHDRGRIEPNLRADLCVWAIERPADLVYAIGANPLVRRIHAEHATNQDA